MLRSLVGALCALSLAALPAGAQIQEVDPSDPGEYEAAAPASAEPVEAAPEGAGAAEYTPVETAPSAAAPTPDAGTVMARPPAADAIPREDVFTAAEGVFGKGAKELGGLLERILKDQGEPVAYIAGQEAGGAFVVGLRYGSGTMRHKVEGDRAVYWTGPSIGFDAGADANKVFVLVYNLDDSQQLFRRYPAAEGHAYALGGFTASYLRRGNVVLIPVRLGVGWRLGVNAGYMNFTEKSRWLPF